MGYLSAIFGVFKFAILTLIKVIFYSFEFSVILTLVSMFYYLQSAYKVFRQAAMD
jgi:hypothetical protein